MITRRTLLTGTALALAAPAAYAQTTNQKVYLALSKDIKVSGSGRVTADYQCNTANVPCTGPRGAALMNQYLIQMKGDMLSHAPCDEVTVDGTFTLTWTALVRVEVSTAGTTIFGTHAGSFVYQDTCQNVAKGTMQGTIDCGTHRAPNLSDCEDCRPQLHFEGLLKGKFTSGPFFTLYANLGGAQLEATYAGSVQPSWPVAGAITAMSAGINLDGVYILPCTG